MFLWSGGGTKTKYAIFGKNVRSPRTLFFLENTAFIFGVKRRTNERSERNCETEVERLQGGRAESSQGRQSRCRNRAERAKGGGRRAKARRPSQGRASGASEHLPTKCSGQQLGRREVQSLCSVFATLGGQHAPHWRRHGKETERNGGRIVFCCHLFMNTGS